jgi:hypothetical protein
MRVRTSTRAARSASAAAAAAAYTHHHHNAHTHTHTHTTTSHTPASQPQRQQQRALSLPRLPRRADARIQPGRRGVSMRTHHTHAYLRRSSRRLLPRDSLARQLLGIGCRFCGRDARCFGLHARCVVRDVQQMRNHPPHTHSPAQPAPWPRVQRPRAPAQQQPRLRAVRRRARLPRPTGVTSHVIQRIASPRHATRTSSRRCSAARCSASAARRRSSSSCCACHERACQVMPW